MEPVPDDNDLMKCIANGIMPNLSSSHLSPSSHSLQIGKVDTELIAYKNKVIRGECHFAFGNTLEHLDNYIQQYHNAAVTHLQQQTQHNIPPVSTAKDKETPDNDFVPLTTMIKFYPRLIVDKIGYEPTLYDQIMTRHPPSWSEFFLSAQPEIEHACRMINDSSTGRALFPLIPRVLAAFWLTPLFLLKAVIIGQDPYPGMTKSGMPKAIGACFASDRGNDVPDSLKTVYEELKRSVEDWKDPGHPDIRCWGRQGVLLLNSALTVEAGKAEAHLGFWKPFTSKLMDFINEKCMNVVFLLWGKKAQKVADSIYTSKHVKLTAYHPSPMNAGKVGYEFVGCDHFNQTNVFLVSKGIAPIDWRVF